MRSNDDFSEKKYELNEAKKREVSRRMVEVYLWFFVALVVAGRFLLDILSRAASVREIFYVRTVDLFFAFLVLIFPLVFRQIFGSYPLESLRRWRAQRLREFSDSLGGVNHKMTSEDAEVIILSDSFSTEDLMNSSVIKLFSYYALSSRKLSKNIYSRAGIYLLVGVLVAFSGLVFFYTQTAHPTYSDSTLTARVAEMAPRFGILFFIELIAFFFLRQYRSAMDEFRYFEAIKRCREETLALMRIAEDSGLKISPIDWVNSGSFYSKAGLIQKDQSSEIIESRKLEKNELELMEKVLEVLSRSKK